MTAELIAIDWGTTNQRAYRLDPDGAKAMSKTTRTTSRYTSRSPDENPPLGF